MIAVPGAAPVTTPVPAPTEAIVASLLLHEPPVVASASVVESPEHTPVAPLIAATPIFRVTTVVVKHPVANV